MARKEKGGSQAKGKATPDAVPVKQRTRNPPTKLQPKGPPFRPRVNGDPEEKL